MIKFSFSSTSALRKKADGEIKACLVYNAYKNWCVENGYYPESNRNFYKALSAKADFVEKRPKAGGDKAKLLIGYKLKDNVFCI